MPRLATTRAVLGILLGGMLRRVWPPAAAPTKWRSAHRMSTRRRPAQTLRRAAEALWRAGAGAAPPGEPPAA